MKYNTKITWNRHSRVYNHKVAVRTHAFAVSPVVPLEKFHFRDSEWNTIQERRREKYFDLEIRDRGQFYNRYFILVSPFKSKVQNSRTNISFQQVHKSKYLSVSAYDTADKLVEGRAMLSRAGTLSLLSPAFTRSPPRRTTHLCQWVHQTQISRWSCPEQLLAFVLSPWKLAAQWRRNEFNRRRRPSRVSFFFSARPQLFSINMVQYLRKLCHGVSRARSNLRGNVNGSRRKSRFLSLSLSLSFFLCRD